MSAAADFSAWLSTLAEPARDQLLRRYGEAAEHGGAVVSTADGRAVPIPPLLTPEPTTRADAALYERDAQALVLALTRLTRWLMTDDGAAARGRLFRAFAPLEATGLQATWREAERLATARVDYLVDVDGRHRALEVNATIPAMQGYSDIIAEAFLREVGAARGLTAGAIDALVDDNGRNTDDLLESLREHYRRLGGTSAAPTIAIIHRAGDAQLGELNHYRRRFTERGSPTELALPSDVRLDAAGHLTVGGRGYDIIYRHVFARRLDPASDFARALMAPARHRILNPLASHLEVKGMLGHLSLAASDEGGPLAVTLGLDDEARTAIARALPWTRVLHHGRLRGPEGETIHDLVATVAAEGERFVLKRSWDYGGRSVFLGAHHDERAAARAGLVMETSHPLSWPQLVAAAVDDPRDEWVVQSLIRFAPRRHLIAGRAEPGGSWRDLYVDRSSYTSLGVDARPSGGASRAAPGKIVNILGGGGLAPLVREDVLARLLA